MKPRFGFGTFWVVKCKCFRNFDADPDPPFLFCCVSANTGLKILQCSTVSLLGSTVTLHGFRMCLNGSKYVSLRSTRLLIFSVDPDSGFYFDADPVSQYEA